MHSLAFLYDEDDQPQQQWQQQQTSSLPADHLQRLWPLLHHSSRVVRREALRTLSCVWQDKVLNNPATAEVPLEAIRQQFQAVLLQEDVQTEAERAWQTLLQQIQPAVLLPLVSQLLPMVLLPLVSAPPPNWLPEHLLVQVLDHETAAAPAAKKQKRDEEQMEERVQSRRRIPSSMPLQRRGCRALAYLLGNNAAAGDLATAALTDALLQMESASRRVAAAWIFASWTPTQQQLPETVQRALLGALQPMTANERQQLQETETIRQQVVYSYRVLLDTLLQLPVEGQEQLEALQVAGPETAAEVVVSVEQAMYVVQEVLPALAAVVPAAVEASPAAGWARQLEYDLRQWEEQHQMWCRRVRAAAGSAVVQWNALPDTLGPLIQPLLQQLLLGEEAAAAAGSLARLCRMCLAAGQAKVPGKMLQKLLPASARAARELWVPALCTELGEQVLDQVPALPLACHHTLQQHFAPADWAVAVDEKQLPLMPDKEELVVRLLQELDLGELLIRCLAPAAVEAAAANVEPGWLSCVRLGETELLRPAAAAWATLAGRLPAAAGRLVEALVRFLQFVEEPAARLGAAAALGVLVDEHGGAVWLLPLVPVVFVPLLGRLSDAEAAVRSAAAGAFAAAVRLAPLAQGCTVSLLPLPASLIRARDEALRFVEQLLDGQQSDPYPLRVELLDGTKLRPYQQDGVNWLAFLQRFGLHGCLCDDMGLGKTLQTVAIVASEVVRLREEEEERRRRRPSLVVCPPTLVSHWGYELNKFVNSQVLRAECYEGPAKERQQRRRAMMQGLEDHVVVLSYNVLRAEVEFFSQVQWLYVILDDGHIIKNPKSKITLACKRLQAQRRLVLSGTPLQNSVLELWSLFDFLMPGYLGDESLFQRRFVKKIAASNTSKASVREQEQGALALEALRHQVLPFVLRRKKEDVLEDLPAKILQDLYCTMSPLQQRLYQDFEQQRQQQQPTTTTKKKKSQEQAQHIFVMLQYLRKLCTHPALVLTPEHSRWDEIQDELLRQGKQLLDLEFAPKLETLRQLLLDCGIGMDDQQQQQQVVGAHRVLLFAQMKASLDLAEETLMRRHMPSVSFLRLDGSVPANERFGIVRQFNEDASIDVLLLTTQVGGLGLIESYWSRYGGVSGTRLESYERSASDGSSTSYWTEESG